MGDPLPRIISAPCTAPSNHQAPPRPLHPRLALPVRTSALAARRWSLVYGVAVGSGTSSGMSSAEPVLFPVLIDAATDPLVKAVAAYLARYRAQTRVHTESDLRAFLVWCRERGIDPLKASRAQIELYVRWMQKSATSSRPRSADACRWWLASTAPVSSTKSWPSRQRTTCAARTCHPSRPRSACHICNSKHCSARRAPQP